MEESINYDWMISWASELLLDNNQSKNGLDWDGRDLLLPIPVAAICQKVSQGYTRSPAISEPH